MKKARSKKKKKKKRGKRDIELDLARQQELFPPFTVERYQASSEIPMVQETQNHPVQQWLFDAFFGRK